MPEPEKGIKTLYEVQFTKEWNRWEPYFSTDNEYAADTIAGWKSTQPGLRVRILEMRFRKGKLLEIKEYGVNPPHCSGNGLPPRGPEKYLRGFLDL